VKLLRLAATILVLPAGAEEGFVPMFNGRDLEGWVNVACAPETWSVRDGVIFCTGKPTGALRTARPYENFILEAEWRHLSSGGNSGIFIWGTPISAPGVPFLRGIEVQVLDHGYAEQYEKSTGKKSDWFTTHGDVFPIHGASMKPLGRHRGDRSFPSEERSRPSPEWNHYRIVANAGSIRLSVNGAEVSGGDECVYRKGYLALESEGAPVEFRNVRIKELPPTGATPEQTAPEAQGHRALYNGLDLRGWKTATPERWQASDWRLLLKAGAPGEALLTEETFADCEVIVDVRLAKELPDDAAKPALLVGGTRIDLPAGSKWTRCVLTVKDGVAVLAAGTERREIRLVAPKGPLGLADCGAEAEFANIFVRPL
jgi:hypothetical protein